MAYRIWRCRVVCRVGWAGLGRTGKRPTREHAAVRRSGANSSVNSMLLGWLPSGNEKPPKLKRTQASSPPHAGRVDRSAQRMMRDPAAADDHAHGLF